MGPMALASHLPCMYKKKKHPASRSLLAASLTTVKVPIQTVFRFCFSLLFFFYLPQNTEHIVRRWYVAFLFTQTQNTNNHTALPPGKVNFGVKKKPGTGTSVIHETKTTDTVGDP